MGQNARPALNVDAALARVSLMLHVVDKASDFDGVFAADGLFDLAIRLKEEGRLVAMIPGRHHADSGTVPELRVVALRSVDRGGRLPQRAGFGR